MEQGEQSLEMEKIENKSHGWKFHVKLNLRHL